MSKRSKAKRRERYWLNRWLDQALAHARLTVPRRGKTFTTTDFADGADKKFQR